ncbi:hypothetical protein FIBSPDRAFT_963367 [Athelia psychrophila]|uniref:Uncharacterized protein n=1 Tax=Athelia psychrophila TaxID=1759441 RepID=A0A165Z3F7_9AGAM|nr:hypothetical protein FIBSPDRAFT_963367 [Fibularhizoctonia sp. CBS 109695]
MEMSTYHPAEYLNFMVLMRSYGGKSAHQYGLLTGQIPGPCPCHLRSLVASSEESLQNPNLMPENLGRVKRFMDAVGYCGPLSFGSDCTKVRPRLTYSTDFGSHILGSTLSMDQCEVRQTDHIDVVLERVERKGAKANQVRAVLVYLLHPGTNYPPMVVALIASSGEDNAAYILKLHMTLRIMGGEIGMAILGGAGDGAASELAAQNLMDQEATEEDPLCYECASYGVRVRANVYTKTGPFISHQDPPHGAKTGRNQPLHGTKASSLGTGFLSAQVLMSICTARSSWQTPPSTG